MHFAYITFTLYVGSWCEFSPPVVVLALFGHFWQKESLLNLPIPLTLSGRGGGGGGEGAQMAR